MIGPSKITVVLASVYNNSKFNYQLAQNIKGAITIAYQRGKNLTLKASDLIDSSTEKSPK